MISEQSLNEVAHELFHIGAIQFGEFRLKLHEKDPHAPLSPIRLNLRAETARNPGPITAPLLKRLCQLMAMKVAMIKTSFTHIVGVPYAGDPYAEKLASLLRKPPLKIIHLSKDTREDERRTITGIEPSCEPPEQHARVLLVDDLITGADSKLEAMDTMEVEIRHLLVIVDRMQGGTQVLEKSRKCQVHALYTLPDLLTRLHAQGCISDTQHQTVLEYLSHSSS